MAPVGSATGPEAQARLEIDRQLTQAGWTLQHRDDMNLAAGNAIAVREFKLQRGHGWVDYMLFLDGNPVGVCEAKPSGYSLTSVELQTAGYIEGLPPELDAPIKPLPFAYISTGDETVIINLLDPHPRSRQVFTFHRPETLREWLAADTLDQWVKRPGGFYTAADDTKPSTLRARLRAMPPVELPNLWPNKVQAIASMEKSLFDDRPRALIQMATGTGKTLLTVASIYRLIKFGGARRLLFLVDRANLGEQAEKEFQSFRTPDDNRKFTELYGVQRLTSNTIGSSSKVVISTIQRLYSILKGEPELDPEAEEHSDLDDEEAALPREPLPVVYNRGVPPEFFDIIFIDECHRSIYSVWRQVLEYFDAHLFGLTATTASHTYGFFRQNVVMEYPHTTAVADGVNCDFEVYNIRTKVTAQGATVDAAPGTMLGYRDRQTRKVRWEASDEPVAYDAADLDRSVVAVDQIRLIIRTFRDKVLGEAFPQRTEVPKTLIFAKDDSHAEDIVRIVREEFGGGNDFCQKITYKVTAAKPADIIQSFRNSFNPRIVVTVDLIATGTDIKPVEIVMFMRSVKSRVLFEQMKGRGVRVINPDELQAVTPDARAKTHFLIVDCVGVSEQKFSDTRPLERKPGVSLRALLDHVAANGTHDDYLSSLASRISRIDKQCGVEDRQALSEVSGGTSLATISAGLLRALDDDVQDTAARKMFDLPAGAEPTPEQLKKAAEPLKKEAILPLMSQPALRKLILDLRQKFEQMVDEVTRDELLIEQTGISQDARDRAAALVHSFESYLAEHKDEMASLQFFYGVPHRRRLRYDDVKGLAAAIEAPPRSWTPEKLWRAYETLANARVHGASGERLLVDLVSLVRFALCEAHALVPYAERIDERFHNWLAQQENGGRVFTAEQRRWLEMMRDHIATSLEIEMDDCDLTPFTNEGGLAGARRVFGSALGVIRPRDDPQESPDVPFIGMEDVEAQTMRILRTVLAGTMKSSATRFRSGDVLYGRLRPYLNKVVGPAFDGLASAEFIPLTPVAGVVSDFVRYRLNHADFVAFTSHLDEGDRPRVDWAGIRQFKLLLPPTQEQWRIVEAIESYLSRLDAAVASLEQARARLMAYRASVLKAAVEGRLVPTEAALARAEKREYERADVLLKRILVERRRRWEDKELAKLRAAGKAPKDDKWKSRYQEPAAPNVSALPSLPEGWCWATLPQLGELARGKSTHRPRNDRKLLGGSYPFVQTSDVKRADTWIRSYDATYSEAGLSQSRLWPSGTVCITIAANIAETAILAFPACFPDSIVGFLTSDPIVARFVEIFVRTAREDLDRYAPATAQKNINLTILGRVAIPLPPTAEQARITEEIDRLLSIASTVTVGAETHERRCARLKQAVLMWAFDGKLVDQNPNDESADELLAKIRAERAASGGGGTRKNQRRKTKAQGQAAGG
jgi:type I restriction enzyme R subunit